jgi:hypothetical protein
VQRGAIAPDGDELVGTGDCQPVVDLSAQATSQRPVALACAAGSVHAQQAHSHLSGTSSGPLVRASLHLSFRCAAYGPLS